MIREPGIRRRTSALEGSPGHQVTLKLEAPSLAFPLNYRELGATETARVWTPSRQSRWSRDGSDAGLVTRRRDGAGAGCCRRRAAVSIQADFLGAATI